MKKVLFVFILFLGIGISFITRAEDYTQSASCINDLVSEYDKFKVNYETSVSKEKYEDALLYIKTMQNYLVSMKSSVCYSVAKDEIVKIYSSLSEIYKKVDTAMVNKNVQDVTNDILAQNSSGNEFQEAVAWMYENKLTSYQTTKDFMGSDYLTREQASKFFVQFAKLIGKTPDTTKSVKLSDLGKANKTLQSYIKEANQMGIFKGNKGKFMPFNKLTISQTLAVIVRSMIGSMDETKNPWYSDYYDVAYNNGVLENLRLLPTNTLDSVDITRKQVALLLYRFSKVVLSINEGNKSCEAEYGAHSYRDKTTTEDDQYNCVCQEGYDWNKTKEQCIPANEVCQQTFGKYSQRDGTYTENGANCSCQEGYDRESDRDFAPCVKK